MNTPDTRTSAVAPQNQQGPRPTQSAETLPQAPSVREWAADIRRRARSVLDGHGTKSHRMTMILAVVVLITVTVGTYMVATGVYMAGYILFGEALWLDVVAYAVMGLVGLLVVLPLAAAAFRLACLAVRWIYPSAHSADWTAAEAVPGLIQLFYPFTSRRAYGRCLAVGLETLGWTALWAGIPTVGFCLLKQLFDYLANRGVLLQLCNLLTVVSFVVCLAMGLLMLFLSGRRAGFGYLAFTCEDRSLGEVNRYFKGLRRSFVKPFVLRMSLVGWIALSVVAILVPFVLHTIPYGLCCGAVYGAELESRL